MQELLFNTLSALAQSNKQAYAELISEWAKKHDFLWQDSHFVLNDPHYNLTEREAWQLIEEMKSKNLMPSKKITIRLGWREIPAEYRNDEDSIPYIKREYTYANVRWERFAYYENDYWCLDGIIA